MSANMNETQIAEMVQYVQSLGAQVVTLQKKIDEQEASPKGAEGTSPANRERESAPEFWGKRDRGREARLWVFSARSYVKAVCLPATIYGAYKLTSRFREDAAGWQINNGKEWKTPQDVIDAVEKEYVNQFDTIAVRQQLLRLKQKRTETLAEYTRNFEELSGRINDYSDEQLVTMYTDGMLPKHREAIIMALPDSMV